MRFLIKIIFFHLPPKEKISYFLEKKKAMPSFQILQKRSYSSAIFWKDHLFKTFEKRKYGFLCSVILFCIL